MGCDGGSIPGRTDLVKVQKQKKSTSVETKNSLIRSRWQTCALTKEQLRPPIVADPLGNLFNKEAVLTALLRKNLPSSFSHIKGMKDLIPVNFTPNPSYKDTAVVADLAEEGRALFVCPVTGLEANGLHGFSVLKKCGCVFSERALREVPSTECLQCREPFTAEDVLPLNPTPEQVEQLRERLALHRATTKHTKKRKNRENAKEPNQDLKEKLEKGKDKAKGKEKEKGKEKDYHPTNKAEKGKEKDKEPLSKKQKVKKEQRKEKKRTPSASGSSGSSSLFVSSAERQKLSA
jgi:hypothetical protein